MMTTIAILWSKLLFTRSASWVQILNFRTPDGGIYGYEDGTINENGAINDYDAYNEDYVDVCSKYKQLKR